VNRSNGIIGFQFSLVRLARAEGILHFGIGPTPTGGGGVGPSSQGARKLKNLMRL
jgi:hypothetical protein